MSLKREQNPAATVDGSKLHKMKQTTLGLYVTAKEAYERLKEFLETLSIAVEPEREETDTDVAEDNPKE